MEQKNNLFEKVYELVRSVPKGKVVTYKDIADYLIAKGIKITPRVVGFALHANPATSNAPCHRVVNRDGRTAPGFAFGGNMIQKKLLVAEGVAFVDEQHVNLASHRYLFK